jgi:hypothetical protein
MDDSGNNLVLPVAPKDVNDPLKLNLKDNSFIAKVFKQW